MNIIYGILIGWVSLYLVLLLYKNLREKQGTSNKEYSKLPFTSRLRNIFRHIIFEYDIKRRNEDFLYTIKLDGKRIIQLMHRAHFPELCISESDIAFGISLYIPVKGWTIENVTKLDNIFAQETELPLKGELGKLEYYVVDLGKRARFGGYLLSRIIKEVFNAEEARFSFELFSEGSLPYPGKLKDPRYQQ